MNEANMNEADSELQSELKLIEEWCGQLSSMIKDDNDLIFVMSDIMEMMKNVLLNHFPDLSGLTRKEYRTLFAASFFCRMAEARSNGAISPKLMGEIAEERIKGIAIVSAERKATTS